MKLDNIIEEELKKLNQTIDVLEEGTQKMVEVLSQQIFPSLQSIKVGLKRNTEYCKISTMVYQLEEQIPVTAINIIINIRGAVEVENRVIFHPDLENEKIGAFIGYSESDRRQTPRLIDNYQGKMSYSQVSRWTEAMVGSAVKKMFKGAHKEFWDRKENLIKTGVLNASEFFQGN